MARNRLETAVEDWTLGISRLVDAPHVSPIDVRRPGEPAVIVLPGVWERWEATWRWASDLFEAGFDVHFIPELDLELGSLPDLGEKLLNWVRGSELDSPLIVAHSKGGLVAKEALVKDPSALRGVIACGTPFDGAPIASVTPLSLRVRNLRPGSPQIQELASNTEANQRIIAIEAAWDQNVPELQNLPGATVVKAPVEGHNHLLEDPSTAKLVTESALWALKNW